MSSGWTPLSDEIARWRDSGHAVEFWWRDDDAKRPDAALERLVALSARSGVPVALAVIACNAEPSLSALLGETVCVFQHGTDHANRAAPGEKKTEFPAAELPEAALARLAAARERLQAVAASHFLPVLAPPWNRLPRHLVPYLRAAGFVGLSQYGARALAEPAAGLMQVNTHLDIIDWRGTRGFIGERAALAAAVRHLAARRTGASEPGEPTGWLTHHAVHDAAAWDFLPRLFDFTRAIPGVSWRRAEEIFHTY